MRKLFFVDLFAGCGGLSLGLENAGFVPVFVNELNHDAMETYLKNRDVHYPKLRKLYHTYNVKDMVLREYYLDDLAAGFKRDYKIDVSKGGLDLLVGGPPCQGYSGIGHRRSYSVEKKQIPSNYLYQDMAYIVSRLRPKIFLFENVRGLLYSRWTNTGTKGEIFQDVLGTFKGLPEYDVDYALVYAKHYGVPQNRPRVLVVGIRRDLGVSKVQGMVAGGYLPEPVNGYPNLGDIWSDLIDPNYTPGGSTNVYPSDAKSEVQAKLRWDPNNNCVKPKGYQLTEQDYSNHSLKIIAKFSYMLAHNGEIHESMKTKKFAQRMLKPEWDELGPTITATSLPDDYVHYSQPRSLTVREWARLQMFPDWYQFAGKRTTGGIRRAGNPKEGNYERELPKYTQIGNAVPVKLAEEIGKHFRRILEEND